jgi:hypothetical protein
MNACVGGFDNQTMSLEIGMMNRTPHTPFQETCIGLPIEISRHPPYPCLQGIEFYD